MAEWAVVLVPFIRSCLDTNMFNSILIRVAMDLYVHTTEDEMANEVMQVAGAL